MWWTVWLEFVTLVRPCACRVLQLPITCRYLYMLDLMPEMVEGAAWTVSRIIQQQHEFNGSYWMVGECSALHRARLLVRVSALLPLVLCHEIEVFFQNPGSDAQAYSAMEAAPGLLDQPLTAPGDIYSIYWLRRSWCFW